VIVALTIPLALNLAKRTRAEIESDTKIDALTIAAGSVAVVGLAGGAGIGVYALSSRPSDFVTGRDGTYATLQQQTDDAHTMAIIADVAPSSAAGVGGIATAFAVVLGLVAWRLAPVLGEPDDGHPAAPLVPANPAV